MESGTSQDEAAKLFNKLPLLVRNCSDFSTFSRATFNYLMERIKKDDCTYYNCIFIIITYIMHKCLRGRDIYHIVFRIVSFKFLVM